MKSFFTYFAMAAVIMLGLPVALVIFCFYVLVIFPVVIGWNAADAAIDWLLENSRTGR